MVFKKNLIFLSVVMVFIIVVLFATSFYSSVSTAQTAQPTPDVATIEKAKNEYYASICSGHGGVNCSEINSGFSIVCNDGTIDESLSSVFSVPQCQETIENLVNQQSDLMAESGCYPPSEITCLDQISYNNTYGRLNALGQANSEFGKIELAECWKEVLAYQDKNNDYKQCLVKNNIAPINLPGDRLVLPILKTIFCPMFYGQNASYDSDLDLCVCDPGYLKYNGTCRPESYVCKVTYGPNSYAQNGYCAQSAPIPTKVSNQLPPIQIQNTPRPTATTTNDSYPLPSSTVQVSPSSAKLGLDSRDTSEPPPLIIIPSISPQNILKNVLNSVMLGIKTIFRIFR